MWHWRTRRGNWKWAWTSCSVLLVTGITYKLAYNYTKMEKWHGFMMETNVCITWEGMITVILIWAVRNVITKTVIEVFQLWLGPTNLDTVFRVFHIIYFCRFLFVIIYVSIPWNQNIGDVFLLKIVRWKFVMKLFFHCISHPYLQLVWFFLVSELQENKLL